jgi:WD40 repeat protein
MPAPKGFGIAGAVAVAPSGRRAAVGDAVGHVLVFDLPTGKLEKTLELPPGEVSGLAWSPGAGKWIAAVGAEEVVSLFEAATGARTTLEGHTGPVNAVAFHPEGKLLATAGSDGTVRIWDIGSPTPRATLNASEKPLNAVAFSEDGKLLAAGGEDRSVRIFETQSRKQKRKIDGFPEAVLALAFSPHASILATSGRDQVVRTFRVNNGEVRSVWSGHGARVRAIAFAPDGETLASASSDGTIRIWDVRTGRQVVRFERPPEAHALAYSKDGALLVSAGEKPALLAIEMGDKASLLAPEPELLRQLKKRKLRLEGIELVEDDEQLAQKTLGKKK